MIDFILVKPIILVCVYKGINNGYEKATKPYIPWSIKCVIEKSTRSEAMVLEKKLKNLNREKLLLFIKKYS